MADSGQAGGIRSLLAMAASISFMFGYIICVFAGVFWPDNDPIIILLFLMGLLVGFFNVTAKEIMPYLVAAIALILIGRADAFAPIEHAWFGLYDNLFDVVTLLAVFTAPAALIQALRAGVSLAAPGD